MAVTVKEKLDNAQSHLERALEGLHEGTVPPQAIRDLVYAVGYLHAAIEALPGEMLDMQRAALVAGSRSAWFSEGHDRRESVGGE